MSEISEVEAAFIILGHTVSFPSGQHQLVSNLIGLALAIQMRNLRQTDAILQSSKDFIQTSSGLRLIAASTPD